MPRKVGTLEKLMMNLWEARAMSAHTVRILFWKFGCLGVCLSPHVFSLMLHISFQSGNLDRPSDFAAVIESLTDRARVWSRHDWLLLVDLKHVNLSEDDGKNMGHTQNPMVYHGLSSLFSLKFGDFFRDIPKKRNWESRPEPDQVSKLRWVLQSSPGIQNGAFGDGLSTAMGISGTALPGQGSSPSKWYWSRARQGWQGEKQQQTGWTRIKKGLELMYLDLLWSTWI